MKLSKIVIIALLMNLAACTKPHIPDPRVDYPAPPAELMQPAEKLKPL